MCELFLAAFLLTLKNCNVSWLNHRTFLGSNMWFITIWGGLHSHNDRGMITAAYDENRSGFDPKVKSSWISTSETTVKLLDFSDIFHEIKHDNWIMIQLTDIFQMHWKRQLVMMYDLFDMLDKWWWVHHNFEYSVSKVDFINKWSVLSSTSPMMVDTPY